MDNRATNDGGGVLLTGATGFLGGELLARLLEREERPVYALVRARSDEEANARLRRVIESLLGSAEPWARNAVAIAADIAQPGLGMDASRRTWLAERVDQVLHCAASVSFTLGLDESRAINVDGTRRMLELAELCERLGGLQCFTHVSTAYVAGDHRGDFGEGELWEGQDFRNAYERSKFEAEELVRGRGSWLPVQVLRPSIVVGDSRTGWTPAFNVLYTPLRAFARGAYKAIPARRSSPVDVVPVDYVAESVLALAGRPGTTYHLTAGERASSVGELIELAGDYLDRPPPAVLSPVLYRRVIHPLLVRQADGARERALRRTEVFFPYFSMRVRYDDSRASEALAEHGIVAPPLSDYFDRLMDFALSADWGRRPLARHETGLAASSVPHGPRQRDAHRRPLPAGQSHGATLARRGG